MLANSVRGFIDNNGSKEDKKSFKKIVKEFEKAYVADGSELDTTLEEELFGKKKELTDAQYQELVDRTYEILGRLGV